MTDVSAGEAADRSSEQADLAMVFTTYARRVRAFILSRLPRPDFHLAEDLTSEVFLWLIRDYTGRTIDGRVWGLLCTMARRALADHFRLARNREVVTDFEGPSGRSLPVDATAEDQALANITVLAMLAEVAPADFEAVAA
jgi:DNA-directed RNA polymerase specialized sigma24 family protein